MPIKNEFYGVFKTLKVGGQYILAESATRGRDMEVEAETLIQGTAKNRILGIGGASESIEIEAPILIGGASVIDGRTLLNTQIANALLPSGATLPILERAGVMVDSKAGGKVSVSLKSDGSPIASVFEVRSEDASALTSPDGTKTNVLDPTSSNGPTRTAKFYDFRVCLAGFYLYVKQAKVDVKVTLVEDYFLAGKLTPTSPNDAPTPVPPAGSNPNNWGTQFPWLGVSGISVSGGGQAAVLLTGNTGSFGDYGTAVNLDTADITLQLPGQVVSVTEPFAIEVYDASPSFDQSGGQDAGAWVSLFSDNTGKPLFDLSQSVVNKADFKVTKGLLTVDFSFQCWVH